jgi:hypothetical protein
VCVCILYVYARTHIYTHSIRTHTHLHTQYTHAHTFTRTQNKQSIHARTLFLQEDEDAIRDVFCDVRFDVSAPPKRVYCLHTVGTIFRIYSRHMRRRIHTRNVCIRGDTIFRIYSSHMRRRIHTRNVCTRLTLSSAYTAVI